MCSFNLQYARRFPLGQWKCEENISVKRPEIANYFELVIFHIWLDARLSNFDGQHSITPRFYPCKVTARVRNKNFTLYNVYNVLNSHLADVTAIFPVKRRT